MVVKSEIIRILYIYLLKAFFKLKLMAKPKDWNQYIRSKT